MGSVPDGATSPRKNDNSGCAEITFVGGDRLDGKVHTNDTPLFTASGGVLPAFPQGLETSDPACQAAVAGTPSSYTSCDRAGVGADYGTSAPSYGKPLYLPDNTAGFSTYPGRQYTGPTRIVMQSGGTMQVWSKQTLGAPATCGGSALTSAAGATVTVPNDRVLYVKSASTLRPCKSKEIDGTLPLGTYDGIASPSSYDVDLNMLDADQRCGLGNVYLEGQFKGRLTIAAQNSIVVTGDTVYAGGPERHRPARARRGQLGRRVPPVHGHVQPGAKGSGRRALRLRLRHLGRARRGGGWPHHVSGVSGRAGARRRGPDVCSTASTCRATRTAAHRAR